MFARIAGRYDLLNRVLSAGIDQRWRRRTVRRAEALLGPLGGKRALDAACGTGDLSLLLAEAGARVAAVDFTPEMLLHALPKDRGQSTLFARGDALCLPARDGSVDLVTIAFGLRNLADRRAGLAELRRVLAPGGAALVLEFTLPPGPVLGALYRFYFTRLLPRLGGAVSGDRGAYTYLPDTVLAWPGPDELQAEMGEAGFEVTGHELFTGGIAALHWGRAPGPVAGRV